MIGKKVTFNFHEIPQPWPLRPFQIDGRDGNMAEKAWLKGNNDIYFIFS